MTVCCRFRSLGWLSQISVVFLGSVADWTLVCVVSEATAGLGELGTCWLSQPWNEGRWLCRNLAPRVWVMSLSSMVHAFDLAKISISRKMKVFLITEEKNLLHKSSTDFNCLEIWQVSVCPPSQVSHPPFLRFSSSTTQTLIIPDTFAHLSLHHATSPLPCLLCPSPTLILSAERPFAR